jgi:hypothetical protein
LRLCGVPHTIIIQELEQQHKEAKVGLNGLTKIIKSMREDAKACRVGLAWPESAMVRLKSSLALNLY